MEKKILENWKAIEETEQKVRDKTGDPKAGFNASSFWFGGDGRHLMIPCMYRGKKGKKGSEEFTSSYKELMVYAKFCPFTGRPLYEDSLSDVSEAKKDEKIKQLESRIKELEATIENMKSIAGEKIEYVGTKTSVDYIDDNTTELITEREDIFGVGYLEITKTKCCGIAPITKENYCPNCGRKIKK